MLPRRVSFPLAWDYAQIRVSSTHNPPSAVSANTLPNWHANFSAVACTTTATVVARGELDVFTAVLLDGALDCLRRAGHRDITLDLTAVSRIDQTGWRAIRRAYDEQRMRGGGPRVKQHSTTKNAPQDAVAAPAGRRAG
jgi:anti-anti-sigma regulatory factor